jgi:threonine/homoserine/homoserine lactone efflux protein
MAQHLALFGVSFLVALSGALSPGPLFTYTVMESSRDRRGWLAGPKVIAGHAVVEIVILAVLLAGLQGLLVSRNARIAIGALGSVSLAYFGAMGLAEAVRELRSAPSAGPGAQESGGAPTSSKPAGPFVGKPVLGGVFISMSNPYWWIWWATFGSTMIARWDLSLRRPVSAAVFLAGHEAGDLAWYLFVSVASSFGFGKLGGRARSWTYASLSAALCLFGGWIAWDTALFAMA